MITRHDKFGYRYPYLYSCLKLGKLVRTKSGTSWNSARCIEFFILNKMTPKLAREYKKLQRRVSRETNIFKGGNRIGIKIIL